MAVRPCFFIVHDDGSFWRVRKDVMYRILLRHDDEVHPEFKRQRIKYAEIYVEYDGRKPVSVRRDVYRYVAFDESGRRDENEIDKFEQLFIRLFPRLDEIERPDVSDAHARRVNADIEQEFGWEPSPELRNQLHDAALGNKLVGGPRQ